ncbi:MAG: hypothetical protein K2J88_04185, partial [Oscillospiraceae bacterium]|nr:hypothetical protein [Oscillospiraceae bacterium]
MKSIKKICMEQKRGKAEIIALLCYIIGVCVIGYFHEPWFDEAQAWQIARSASLKEILFEIPHYEGHPQLWHLVLMPFAKLGTPYEFTLFTINFVFCLASVALILFKSPFPKIVRCFIPFTYFFFYQFGVLSRPYSMMMLAFMLSAMTYSNRNTKPVRYILALCFLCATSAYGILFAGGLCIVWVIEIFQEYQKHKLWNKISKRFFSLLGILIFAILLMLCIIPAKDCYYAGSVAATLNIFKSIAYFLMMPFDSTIGGYLNENVATTGGIIAECVGGVLFWFILLEILHVNKKLITFLVPYILFMIFSVFVYFSVHHLGVSTLFIVFIFWIMAEQKMEMPALFIMLNQKVVAKSIRVLASIVGILAICMPLAYTVISSVNDIFYCYGMRVVAEFIKENNLTDRKIMSPWSYTNEIPEETGINLIIWDETLPVDMLPIKKHYPYQNGIAAASLPYFDENIFMNFNAEDKQKMYLQEVDRDDSQQVLASWQEQGLPEIVIGVLPLKEVYSEEELQDVTYYWVETLKCGKIWKQYRQDQEIKIYIREDVLADYPQ